MPFTAAPVETGLVDYLGEGSKTWNSSLVPVSGWDWSEAFSLSGKFNRVYDF